mmetsp:Transcript_13300/g.31622  ORF Transcript_13300/g.31622 Transcript_13300/m.31622 type:complete len:255 (-) Transcript_13300:49-813(-)
MVDLFAIRANAVGVDEDIDHAVCHAQIAQPAFQVIPVEGYDQLLHLLQLRLHLGKVEVRVPLADPVEHPFVNESSEFSLGGRGERRKKAADAEAHWEFGDAEPQRRAEVRFRLAASHHNVQRIRDRLVREVVGGDRVQRNLDMQLAQPPVVPDHLIPFLAQHLHFLRYSHVVPQPAHLDVQVPYLLLLLVRVLMHDVDRDWRDLARVLVVELDDVLPRRALVFAVGKLGQNVRQLLRLDLDLRVVEHERQVLRL